jgi:alpha-beta hydrolase superfamily lysophospholipase
LAEPGGSAVPRIQTWTASDGYVAHYRHYPPLASRGRKPTEYPLAQLVCLHGIQSHGGWYEYSCARLAQAGYEVFYLDRRGSGLNAQARGDAPSFRRLLDDLAEFVDQICGRTPEAPVVLVACSWGGKLAPALCKRHPWSVDGLVLIAPGLFPKVRPPFGQRLGILASRLVKPTKPYPIPLSDPALFTATAKWQEFIRNDPLSLHEATARLLVESVRLDAYLRWTPRHVQVPVLLQLAEHDRIIRNDRTRGYVERFATPDRQIIEYKGAHHTLEFEPDPDSPIDDVIRWLQVHEEVLRRRRQLHLQLSPTS